MKFSIITIFPEMIRTYTDESILGRAQADEQIGVSVYDPRDFTEDKHNSVDAPPYGGGPGMVMQAEPVLRAVEAARSKLKVESKKEKVIVLSAQGEQFDSSMAEGLAADIDHLILICGRYEGIDRRVLEALDAQEVSVGPYILTGGELPALIIADATARFVPGVLGNEDSLESERPAGSHIYTRPETITYNGEEYAVPEVLLSGHHAKIEEWRAEQANKDS